MPCRPKRTALRAKISCARQPFFFCFFLFLVPGQCGQSGHQQSLIYGQLQPLLSWCSEDLLFTTGRNGLDPRSWPHSDLALPRPWRRRRAPQMRADVPPEVVRLDGVGLLQPAPPHHHHHLHKTNQKRANVGSARARPCLAVTRTGPDLSVSLTRPDRGARPLKAAGSHHINSPLQSSLYFTLPRAIEKSYCR